jgi:hypothetical protein
MRELSAYRTWPLTTKLTTNGADFHGFGGLVRRDSRSNPQVSDLRGLQWTARSRLRIRRLGVRIPPSALHKSRSDTLYPARLLTDQVPRAPFGHIVFSSSKAATLSAASRTTAGRMCEYRSAVMQMLAWPRLEETVLRSTPAARARLPAEWRVARYELATPCSGIMDLTVGALRQLVVPLSRNPGSLRRCAPW